MMRTAKMSSSSGMSASAGNRAMIQPRPHSALKAAQVPVRNSSDAFTFSW